MILVTGGWFRWVLVVLGSLVSWRVVAICLLWLFVVLALFGF